MVVAASTAAGKASPLWLVGYFFLTTIGELHLAPVGLALISKLAPARVLSMMMGVWFAATLPADILAGFLGGFWSTHGEAEFLSADCVRRRLRERGDVDFPEVDHQSVGWVERMRALAPSWRYPSQRLCS